MVVYTCDKCGKKIEDTASRSVIDVGLENDVVCGLSYYFRKNDEYAMPMELCDECMAKLVAEVNKKVGNMK